jgi:hypothetical protein
MEHLKGDLTALVLKGHLLIEVQLRSVISAYVAFPEAVLAKDANFSFRALARIARAVSFRVGDEWVWECVTAINELRNELAHKLEPDVAKVETKIDRVLELMHKNELDTNGHNAKEKQLRSAIAFTYGQLMGIKSRRVGEEPS